MFHKRLYTKGSEQLWKLGWSASQFLSYLKPQQATLTANRLVLQWSGSVTPDLPLAGLTEERVFYIYFIELTPSCLYQRFTHIRLASYKLPRHLSIPHGKASPASLPWRFLCSGFPFTFGLKRRFQSTLRLEEEFQVMKKKTQYIILLPQVPAYLAHQKTVLTLSHCPHKIKDHTVTAGSSWRLSGNMLRDQR